MLILIIIESVLFIINPLWATVGAPVCVFLFLLSHCVPDKSSGNDSREFYEDEEINWELDDMDKRR